VKFSVTIPGFTLFPGLGGQPDWSRDITPDQIQLLAHTIDELGYDQIAVPWHLAVERGDWAANMGPRWPHALTAAGFVLGATRRVQLLTMVVGPCVQPVELAKSIATLDWMSGGRLVPVLLAGYLRWEFDLLGADFGRRDDVLDDYVRALLVLWRNEVARYRGEFTSFEDVIFDPKPGASLRLWFGGRSKRALRRVAEHGDGWMSYGMRHAEHAPAVAYIRSQPGFASNPRPLEVAAYFLEPTHDPISHEESTPPVPVTGTGAVLERLAYLASLGVTSTGAAISARPGDGPARSIEHHIEQLRWFASDVMPAARSM
jgi:alkanesulfonate monooxygenase SsuD/methylene tetrahydromethanopterin reductase-like flavin-dependent oxidoreductase (luciferase family)